MLTCRVYRPSNAVLQHLRSAALSSIPQHAHNAAYASRFYATNRKTGGNRPTAAASLKSSKGKTDPVNPEQPQLLSGKIEDSPLFEEEDRSRAAEAETKDASKTQKAQTNSTSGRGQRIKDIPHTEADPNPRTRLRKERKLVTRAIHRRERMSEEVKLARAERSHTAKSPFFKTSVKKLMMLARQIAGKPLDQAMLQMRFSKKKASKDILEHLEYARNEAMVEKRMGLKMPIPKPGATDQSFDKVAGTEEKLPAAKDGATRRAKPINLSRMYIEEAWVGRGSYSRAYDYRARGRANILRPPKTSITVVLKEARTQVRKAAEKEARRKRKKVWVHYPDAPVHVQKQHLLW